MAWWLGRFHMHPAIEHTWLGNWVAMCILHICTLGGVVIMTMAGLQSTHADGEQHRNVHHIYVYIYIYMYSIVTMTHGTYVYIHHAYAHAYMYTYMYNGAMEMYILHISSAYICIYCSLLTHAWWVESTIMYMQLSMDSCHIHVYICKHVYSAIFLEHSCPVAACKSMYM